MPSATHVRALLARLAFSLLIIGIALAWSARSAAKAGNVTRATLGNAGAVLFIVAGFAGVKLRHGPRRPGMPPVGELPAHDLPARDKLRDPESEDPRPPVS